MTDIEVEEEGRLCSIFCYLTRKKEEEQGKIREVATPRVSFPETFLFAYYRRSSELLLQALPPLNLLPISAVYPPLPFLCRNTRIMMINGSRDSPATYLPPLLHPHPSFLYRLWLMGKIEKKWRNEIENMVVWRGWMDR